jgi:hypothetical protein
MALTARNAPIRETELNGALEAVERATARLKHPAVMLSTMEALFIAARNAWALLYTAVLLSGNARDPRGYRLRDLLLVSERRLAGLAVSRPALPVAQFHERIAFYGELLCRLHEEGFEAVDEANCDAIKQAIANHNLLAPK